MSAWASWWVVHILAMHLNVPEPVRFELWESPWPEQETCAQMKMIGQSGLPEGWVLQYQRKCWSRHPERRAWVIAHELCHTVHEIHQDWYMLSKKEQKKRHKVVDECAAKILRDHREEP